MRNVRSPIADHGQLSRREFLRTGAMLGASAAGMGLLSGCGIAPAPASSSSNKLETTTIRIASPPTFASLCVAPQYLAEDFLREEGFTDVQYVALSATKDVGAAEEELIAGNADMSLAAAPPVIVKQERGQGQQIVVLSGSLVGCFELFGTDKISTIADLKGSTIPVDNLGNSQHIFLSSIVAWAGLDPNKDINWIVMSTPDAIPAFAKGEVDAFLAFPPGGQTLRAKKIGHVILNSMMDKPWAQYYCCMPTVRREFMQKNPVATKRALRAFLKATDICAQHPDQAARFMVKKGATDNYDYALDFFSMMPYSHWRDYDPADTLTFYALHLRDAGLIKSNPDQLINNGTDWRFLNELKKEL